MITPVPGTPSRPAPAAPPETDRPPVGDVEFSYNPQDRVVMEPKTTVIGGVKAGPSTDRVALAGRKLKAKDGKYVFPHGEKGHYAAATLATVAKTLHLFEQACGQKIPWAFGDEKITLVPDGGEMINAYYSRHEGSLNFFHATDPVTKEVVYSGGSGEVVAHEAGHAILDGLRPDYLGAWSPDPGGFHEAFGDVIAMLVTLQDDDAVAKIVEQCGGDLSKPNLLAFLGEELGVAINHTEGRNVTGGPYTRNAINTFKWADPSTLPHRGGPDELGSEVHSYSRLWTGAFYDTLKAMVDSGVAAGQTPAQALRAAGDEALAMYGNLMKEAPHGDFTYRQMAEAMLKSDEKHMAGRNSELLRRIFTERLILPASPEARLMVEPEPDPNAPPTRTLAVTLTGGDYGMFEGARVETPVDGSNPLAKDVEARNRLKGNLKRLIAEGRILYTEPHQKITPKDYFDPEGRPYLGIVRWEDGQMVIERLKVTT